LVTLETGIRDRESDLEQAGVAKASACVRICDAIVTRGRARRGSYIYVTRESERKNNDREGMKSRGGKKREKERERVIRGRQEGKEE